MEDFGKYCQIIENLFKNEDELIIELKDFNEFPCKAIDDEDLKKLKTFNFDFIKEKINSSLQSADILIIFKEFILLIEFKNPYYDRAIYLENIDGKEREKIIREKLEVIVNQKYKPVITGSVEVCKSLFKKENINQNLWIGFLVDFTEEFLNRLDYTKKLKKLASKKTQYKILEATKKEILKILQNLFENLNEPELYELSIWECPNFYKPFFYLYKKDIVCPK
jgi:hypothetical protein